MSGEEDYSLYEDPSIIRQIDGMNSLVARIRQRDKEAIALGRTVISPRENCPDDYQPNEFSGINYGKNSG
jgi:hypothetical protein